MKPWLLTLGIVAAGPAVAHPHVFIDTRIEVIIDETNAATGLRITWTYDDLFSLYIVGDMGLDPDWDGKLTPEEEGRLAGFDMNWDADFPGDTYALQGEAELALSRPKDWTAGYAEGRITSTHLRTFDAPIPLTTGEPLIVQVYDPGYYTAYTLVGETGLTGGKRCMSETFVPDLDAADEALKAALAEFTPDIDLEMSFPAVGKNYAEEIRVSCAAL